MVYYKKVAAVAGDNILEQFLFLFCMTKVTVFNSTVEVPNNTSKGAKSLSEA